MDKPRVGISSCLVGLPVRYDGSSKFNGVIIEGLGDRVELIPICPESDCGMPVPRQPMELYRTSAGIRLKTVETGTDLTEKIASWIENRLLQLHSMDIQGFIFKSGSPSCGIESALIHENGNLHRHGTGVFAEAFKTRFPQTAAVEDTELDTSLSVKLFAEKILRDQKEVSGAES